MTIIASRASYIAHKGPIPEGMFVMHTCDRPSCINIEHLKLGTNADNMRDCALKERTNKSSLTSEVVRRIREDSRLQRIIAAEHGITQVAVSRIKLRKSWRYVE